MRKIAVFIAVSVLLSLCSTPALANGIPTLPHAFYGSVTVNGAPASSGTKVSATADSGSVITNAQNPVTTVGGSYGINGPYLLVQGDISPGAIITFYVNGVSTGQTATFEAGGGPTRCDLSVTISAPPAPSPPAVGGGAAPIYLTTNLFGVEGSFSINSEGIIQETINATSADGRLTITIPAGTKALDKDGKPLTTLTAVINPTPPPPPEGANIIGLPYDFEPEGATFDPPITFTWSYDPAGLPEGMAEEDLVIAYYDATAGKWVELVCVVDTVNKNIVACSAHFTTFVIMGKPRPAPEAPTPPAPEEEVVPPVEEVVPPVEEVAPPVEEVAPLPEEEVVTPAEVNWPLIGGAIATVVILAILVIFLMVRRRAY